MLKFALVLLVLALTSARQDAPTLALMQSQTSQLEADAAPATWRYSSPQTPSTVLVETLSGSLDPALEVLNLDGEPVYSNDDFAPAYSTAARVSLPPGEYILQVRAVYGTGAYRISALPGDMHWQWDDDLRQENPFWRPFGVRSAEGFDLQTPLTHSRLYFPLGSPRLSDVYIQARYDWAEFRAGSEAGLAVRARRESNGQIGGVRLEVSPNGRWALNRNDGFGGELELASGVLLGGGEALSLGLLAEGERVAAFADGLLLAEVEDSTPHSEWGVFIYDGKITLQDFWLATPARTPLNYPPQLENWAATHSEAITDELIEAGVLPTTGKRIFGVPSAIYTASGGEQRNFLLSDPELVFDDVVIGLDVRFIAGVDMGCGVLMRFNGRENRVLSFVDNQDGAGLVWWKDDLVRLTNYFLLPKPSAAQNRLLLIAQDHFLTLYANGELVAQSLVPRRTGNIGVGFLNYAQNPATCEFRDIWVWG